jgi:hypothetical protein
LGGPVLSVLSGLLASLEVLDFLTLLLQFLGGVEGNVCLAGIEQLLHILLIDVAALALTVRSLVATKGDALVELNAEPLETLDDILLGARHETVRVSILDTEYQVAAMLLGKQVIIQCGTHTANMQSPCRTWGKTHSYFSF